MFSRKEMGLNKTITGCPHTKGTGIVHIPEWLIAELCGAVEEPNEWAIILKGRVEEGGRLCIVDDYTIPDQERSGGYVNIGEVDNSLQAGVVGVIHSHHVMGAFFSGTDINQLNPRFPLSIVVARKANQYLGFSYKATGKFTLPCGAQGKQAYLIQPVDGEGHIAGPVIASMDSEPSGTDLNDCNNFKEVEGDRYQVGWEAACGLKETGLRPEAFGVGESLIQLIGLIPAVVYEEPVENNKGYTVKDRRFTRNGVWVDNEGRSATWMEDKTSVYSADEEAADEWLKRQAEKDERRRKLGLEDPQDKFTNDIEYTRFIPEGEDTVYVVDAVGNVVVEEGEWLRKRELERVDDHGYTGEDYTGGKIE